MFDSNLDIKLSFYSLVQIVLFLRHCRNWMCHLLQFLLETVFSMSLVGFSSIVFLSYFKIIAWNCIFYFLGRIFGVISFSASSISIFFW